MTVAIVPRLPRRRRQSRMPLLLQLLSLRIRLAMTRWRYAAGRKVEIASIVIGLGWLGLKLQALVLLRRLLDWLSPPRK